jgi:hypothetical protein
LARVDAQREKLKSQLSELEATERVLARYSTGARVRKSASAKTSTPVTPATQPLRSEHAGALPQNPLAASAPRRRSAIKFSPWQTARRSRKSPVHAKELARTMLAWL